MRSLVVTCRQRGRVTIRQIILLDIKVSIQTRVLFMAVPPGHDLGSATLFSHNRNQTIMPVSGHSRLLFIALLIVLTIAVAVTMNNPDTGPLPANRTGTLTGYLTIGPLCPVEPCTTSHDQIVTAYAARPIMITTEGGTFIRSVTADPDSGYSVALEPGTYVVDIRHQGIGGSGDLPKTVTIHPGETVRLDISIDTGIR
jgi:hypothetical protein